MIAGTKRTVRTTCKPSQKPESVVVRIVDSVEVDGITLLYYFSDLYHNLRVTDTKIAIIKPVVEPMSIASIISFIISSCVNKFMVFYLENVKIKQ